MEEIWLLLECLNILIQIPTSPQCYNIYLLIYWLCWVVVCGVCASCGEQGLLSSGRVRASGCSGFSCCGTQASGTQASVVVAWQALWLWFSGPGAWAL